LERACLFKYNEGMKKSLTILLGMSIALVTANLRAEELDRKLLESLAESASLIVVGTVRETGEPGDGTTWVRIYVNKLLKGSMAGEDVIVVMPVGRRHPPSPPVVDPEQPSFQLKEKTTLFLREAGDHFELCQGKLGHWPGKGPKADAVQAHIKLYLGRKTLR